MATKHPTHKTNFNQKHWFPVFIWQPPSILHLNRAALVLVTCLKPPADSLGSQPRVQLTTYRSDNGIILGRCQAFRHICRTWRGLIQTFFVSTRKEQSCTTNPVHLLKTAQGLHIYIYIILYIYIYIKIILYICLCVCV